MIVRDGYCTALDAALAPAKAYLRIEGAAEDAAIAALIAASVSLAEQFTGQLLVSRGVAETLAAARDWRRLGGTPVSAITGVETAGEPPTALDPAAFAIDIDASGDGWVRIPAPVPETLVRVRYTAGLAAGWSTLPESLAQGVLRLTAHLHAARDAGGEQPLPAAVAALWRPWRRMRIR